MQKCFLDWGPRKQVAANREEVKCDCRKQAEAEY